MLSLSHSLPFSQSHFLILSPSHTLILFTMSDQLTSARIGSGSRQITGFRTFMPHPFPPTPSVSVSYSNFVKCVHTFYSLFYWWQVGVLGRGTGSHFPTQVQTRSLSARTAWHPWNGAIQIRPQSPATSREVRLSPSISIPSARALRLVTLLVAETL